MRRILSISLMLALVPTVARAGTFKKIAVSGSPACRTEHSLRNFNANGISRGCAPLPIGVLVYVMAATRSFDVDPYSGKVVTQPVVIGYLADPSRSGATNSMILYQYGMLYFNAKDLSPASLPGKH